ncbi:ran-binding protein 3 isoform X2 [Anoplophora glabripennis]|nr:ran-binding protein 3 isoform X2 [Anoplophora glabripennis]
MKIDEPIEDSHKKEVDDNEKNACSLKSKEEFKICSASFRSSVASSTNNPFASSQNKFTRGILKPPQLSLNNSVTTPSNKSFVLKPSQLNPFVAKSDSSDKSNSEKTDCGDKKLNQVNGETPKFVPLIVPENKAKVTTQATSNQPSSAPKTTVSSNSFIFGQNIKERVVSAENKLVEEVNASTSLSSNGTSDMLFSSAIKNEVKGDCIIKEKESKSLSESAREYEESRANKRKYEEVEVITGEEQEVNILNISCKLFAFDKASGNWQERGRGTLRLNDFEMSDNHLGSRLVFRTAGSLRVILNTKIWAEMTIDKASDKSIRLTALDANGEIKVFLIMTNIEDSNKLYLYLKTRLEREVFTQKRKKLEVGSEPVSDDN